MAKSISANAVFKSILNICNIIIPVIVGPYVLRVLNREYYDLYNSINSLFQFFLIFGALGIYNYGVREISKRKKDGEDCNRFVTELFIIGVVTNLLVLAAYLGFSFFTEKDTLTRILCCVMSAQFFGNVFNFEWVNEANENYGFIAVKSIIVKILYFVGIFVFVRESDDIVAYVALLTGSTVLNVLASFIYIKRRYKFVRKGLCFRRHVFPVLFTFIIVNIMLFYSQFDKVMLKYFVDDKSVTAYQIPQYISSLCYSVVIAIVTVTIPRVANLISQGQSEEAVCIHQSSSDVFFMFMIPITIGICLLAKEIIWLYGGDAYGDCAQPLMIYAVLQLISSIHYILGDAYLYITGHEKLLLLVNATGAVVNIGLNFIFIAIDKFSASTAAITLLIAYATIGLIDILLVRKKYKYKLSFFNKHTILYALSAALFIPVILLLRLAKLPVIWHVVISFFSCVLLYAILLFIFKDGYFVGTFEKLKARFKRK